MADEKELNPTAEAPAEEEVQAQAAGDQEIADAQAPPEAEQAPATPEGDTPEGDAASAEPAEGQPAEGDAEADMMAMLKDLPDEEGKACVDDINIPDASVSKAEFQQLSEQAGDVEGRNIELLMDVNLPISIELGRTRMPIADILALGPGSVVELNKLAGEPVDLLVNQKIVARGEVVVIDENFGVRITQLMTPEERLKSLGEEY